MTKRGMGGLGDETAREVDKELASEEARLLLRTRTNLTDLRPQISDKAAFNLLLQAVQTSTEKNESVAEFKNRLEALGKGVLKVAKEVYGLVK
jgi:hypothetical protein